MRNALRSSPAASLRCLAIGALAGLGALGGFGCTDASEGSGESREASPEVSGSSHAGGRVAVRGEAPPASRGFRSVIAFVREDEDAAPGEPSEAPPGMDQFSREFYPDVLTAAPGQDVEFANSEEEMHNVHVREVASGETVFNVGTPAGASYKHRFEAPGAYHVTCDVHSEMEAFLIVVPGRVVKASKDGGFELEGLAAGRYRVRVWNAGLGFGAERTVELEGPEVSLDLTAAP